jgi:hypothetical protein
MEPRRLPSSNCRFLLKIEKTRNSEAKFKMRTSLRNLQSENIMNDFSIVDGQSQFCYEAKIIDSPISIKRATLSGQPV